VRFTGAATNYQVDLLLDHADALEKVGVVSKENIYIAQSQLATFDLSAKTIKDLTPAILDYVTAEKGASASADDFKSMTNGLAQALQGNFASLTKTGFVLDENTKKQIKTGTESQRVAAIIGVLDSTYKGFNKSLLDTPEGQLVKLKQGFGDLKEEVGYGLLRSLQLVNGALGDVGVTTETVAEKLQGMGKEVGLVIEGLGALTAEVITSANSTERSFKGLLATFVTEITSAALTVPRWIVDWLQGKAPSTQFPKANASHAEHSKLAVAANKAREALKSQDVVTKDLAKTQDNLKKNTESLIETSISYAKFVAGTTPQSIQGATALAQGALATIQKQMSKQPKINDDLVKSFKDLATVIQTNFSYALDQAKTKLNEAKQQYDTFKNSIKSAITGVISFTTIEEGSTFLDTLTEQSKKAQDFGGKIQQLLAMGLNQSAITQVADAGYEVGLTIADEIIAGGSTVVQQVNTLVASVESVGETVSTSLAEQFHSAGVNAAQSLVDALINELNASAAIIAEAIKNATEGGSTTPPPKKSPPPKKTPPPPKSSKPFDFGFRANGGPVKSGFPYIIGERGPELFMPNTSGSIIPNNKLSSKSSSNINITVNAGIGANGAQIGREIVDAIKKYERTSGPVFKGA